MYDGRVIRFIILAIATMALMACAKREALILGEAAAKAEIRKAANKPEGKLTKTDLEKVTELDLHEKGLTDASSLTELTHLKKLHLGGNQLTDVNGLAALTQLEELNLGGNQLTDLNGLKGLTHLKEIHLNSNLLTDLTALSELTELNTINLHYNPDLTRAKIAKLQKALPKCKIYHSAEK